MTTIIIVVVVALVFFVAVCVVTFMVWKRESELRTDSIRAIEQNLEKLTYGLAQVQNERQGNSDLQTEILRSASQNEMDAAASAANGRKTAGVSAEPTKRHSSDPFSWVRDDEQKQTEQRTENDSQNRNNNEQANIIDICERSASPAEPMMDSGADGDNDRDSGENPDYGISKSAGDNEENDTGIDAVSGEINLDFLDELDGMDKMLQGEAANVPEASSEEQEKKDDDPESDELSEHMESRAEQLMELGERQTGDLDNTSTTRTGMGYDIGRSGKKYTADELETLIKE